MSKIAINKSYIAIALGVALFIMGLIFWAVQSYHSLNNTESQLSRQTNHFQQLSQDIEKTRLSIDKMKKEQEEFKGLLFDERDVPSFLDGISASAAKSSVYVMEVKTQQFSQVTIPKGMMENNHQLSKLKSSEAPDDSKSEDRETKAKELTQMLTLAAMPIHIQIHGTFNAIVNFLNSVEGYRQLLTISNVQIATRRDYPQLTCDFTLRIYSIKKLRDINL